MAIFIHLASVWVPFTSEAKEAVAHYPELLREITLALQDCGRRLAQSLRARARLDSEAKRRSLFERYIPELGMSIGKITGRARDDIEKLFLKALPNFVNMNEPPPELPPTEGGPAGGAAAPDEAPPSAGDADAPKKKKGTKTGDRMDTPAGDGAVASKRASGKKAKAAKVNANANAKAKGERPSLDVVKVAEAKTTRGKAKDGAQTGRAPAKGKAKKGGRGSKAAGAKKGEQLKLIE
jgi:hypothetical protein